MAKLYIFAIGGTGSRVLRSFTMMLASGVNMDNIQEVIPIIIDPDNSNASLSKAVGVMRDYNKVRNYLTFANSNPNNFFKIKIQELLPNYTLPISNTNDRKFHQFIDFNSMDRENKAMVKMLFSDKNLNSTMNVGFKGNPNVGSIVLNQIAKGNEFERFANNFSQGDKIFIISSIFGGTGASGFPLLLKTLRYDRQIPNFNIINQSEIGALTVLPYFKVEQNDNSEIDSSTFISKTKSALAYYENNVVGNNDINALYYLSDDMNNSYGNCEGGAGQDNIAHLIEFFGATAIINFAINDYSWHDNIKNTANLELGLNDYGDTISFEHFPTELNNVRNVLTQMLLFANYLQNHFEEFSKSAICKQYEFDKFFSTEFYSNLNKNFKNYKDWLRELKENMRSLNIFNVDNGLPPFDIVTGINVKESGIFKRKGYTYFDNILNSERCNSNSKEDKFMEVFFNATKSIIREKFNMQ